MDLARPVAGTTDVAPSRELRGFLTGFAIVVGCFVPVSVVNVFVLHRSRSAGGLIGAAVVLVATLGGRRLLDRGNVRGALLAALGVLMLSSLIFLAVDPGLAPTLALMPLLGVALAMPHVSPRDLRVLSVGAIVVTATIVTIGELLPERDDLPEAYLAAIRWASFLCLLVLVLWLLLQHRGQLVDSLRRARDAEQRFRTLVEQMPAVTRISHADGSGSAIYNSPQLETLLGYPLQAWLDDPDLWPSVLHPDDREAVLEANRRTVEDGDPFAMEYRMIAADGRVVWVREQAVRVDRPDAESVVLGVMFDVTERVESEEERRRLEGERQRLITQLVNVQEEERRRIANDIHDDPVQKMSAVGMRLAALRRSVDDPSQLEALTKLEGSVTSAVSRLRHLMFELQPPSLEREGLGRAVQEYLFELTEETGIGNSLALELDPTVDLPMEVRTVVYRIAQEALSNVRKHARGDRVEVRLRAVQGGVHLEIADDGIGFDPGDPVGSEHLGVRSMRERAELVGGWLRIDSGAGGTTVRCWVPIAHAAPLREHARV